MQIIKYIIIQFYCSFFCFVFNKLVRSRHPKLPSTLLAEKVNYSSTKLDKSKQADFCYVFCTKHKSKLKKYVSKFLSHVGLFA